MAAAEKQAISSNISLYSHITNHEIYTSHTEIAPKVCQICASFFYFTQALANPQGAAMPKIYRRPTGTYRVTYTLRTGSQSHRLFRSAADRAEAKQLGERLVELERAVRTGIARRDQLDEWIARGWLPVETAVKAFPVYEGPPSAPHPYDRRQLLDAYARVTERSCREKTAHINLYRARRILDWLDDQPLAGLTTEKVQTYLHPLRANQSPWTMHHYHGTLRSLLDCAVDLGMTVSNPARDLPLPVGKRQASRRILTPPEAEAVLTASLRPEYRRWLAGGVPTVARLGLYAGLRNSEMAWLTWNRVDLDARVLTITPTRCEATGELWYPKDGDIRAIDLKPACVDYLRVERQRQIKAGLPGPFVIPTRHGKPTNSRVMLYAWADFATAESWQGVSIYSLRHTYCTTLLRSGLDLQTVQRLMGHASIATTEYYLHAIEPEAHPTDRLPY
jgi:integrase/recombinase XerD